MNNVSAYALRLGDNGLVLSQRLGAWCGHAPELEIDLALIAAIGQGVFIALTLPFSGVGQKIARLPEQIKADIGERQVNFQLRRVAAPGAQTL
ncbi:hypothetical protein A3N53_20080 [Enterobacter hormaechei subsp. steigerwaltii]|nr:hypothetical protein A3N49_12190 [Enterobacter hormaechei subsp. steigerwaltii]KZR21455.1 hypothetical protein A3N53_20080 [Enterobacter hormaechei subsp. steigerwaltii]